MQPYNGSKYKFKYKSILSSKTKGSKEEARNADRSKSKSLRHKIKLLLKKYY